MNHQRKLEMTSYFHRPGLDRRNFLQLALMTSAMLMSSSETSIGEKLGSGVGAGYRVFREMPPRMVQPTGWLRSWLEMQAAQLGYNLPQVSWPFSAPYWEGEEEAEAWWPWEQKAYWLDGATRLALILNDQRLMSEGRKSLDYTLSHIAADGYIGPAYFEDPIGDFHRWPHAILFRGLAALADGEGKRGIVEAIRKHYLSDHASYGSPIRNVTNIEIILWCYELTGDRRLIDLAEGAWAEFSRHAGDDQRGDLTALRVFADTPINAHGVTYAETSKLPVILYTYTGKQEYLEFALAAQRRIFDHHMLVDGIPSTSEFYRTRTSLDSHETCDIVDHTWTWGYMLMATGDAIWADRIERACFNAGYGAIKKDWKALQYFSCPNQFLATLNSDHNVLEHGGRKMAFQPNPGQRTACCGGNVHRLFPNFVSRMWMNAANGGVAAVLYGPSALKTTAGRDSREIEIVEDTDYPFDETIHFKMILTQPVSFPLSLRIPGWCDAPHLLINSKSVPMPPIRKGFLVVDRTFLPDDTVTLILPMKPAVAYWPQGGISVEHGPLVFALPIRENWMPVVERDFSTEEFPSWNATPSSQWNYGLVIKPESVASAIAVKRKPMTDNPWNTPPITLAVAAREIMDWKLQVNPDDLNQSFTPCLPDMNETRVSEVEESITLVPYGATHLRVTIFPEIKTPFPRA
jgi:hypothetical protein